MDPADLITHQERALRQQALQIAQSRALQNTPIADILAEAKAIYDWLAAGPEPVKSTENEG